MPNFLVDPERIEIELHSALKSIHSDGPIDPAIFEKLAYIKVIAPKLFEKHEQLLVTLTGLFFKGSDPQSLTEKVYYDFAGAIYDETGHHFTPVQAHAYNNIKDRRYFSFSAPTSAGKSYLFRELIRDTEGDIVIVLPSRALISEYFYEVLEIANKTDLVLQFIENVNTARLSRRIFIITPERGGDLFQYSENFSVNLFLFDEAQISEEPVRGVTFDSFVRRVDRVFPNAKKVFAHPFISNPQAQLKKHKFAKSASSMQYNLNTVGKLFIQHNSGEFSYFSPYTNERASNRESDIAEEILKSNGTLLIYMSKQKLYHSEFLSEFGKYIDLCPYIKDDAGLQVIEELRKYIGASAKGEEKRSVLLSLMARGVVLHHGSMPLKARLLIEKFVRSNHARICFATSTLVQGINMPFDVVWIDNFYGLDALTLRNLLGRSGRSTSTVGKFDIGYTIVNKKNVPTFTMRLKETISIGDKSQIDETMDRVPEDSRDLVEAIKSNSFNDELHLTNAQIDRLRGDRLFDNIRFILDNLTKNGIPISGNSYYQLDPYIRKKVKDAFKAIYVQHLRRGSLTTDEMKVLSAAIPIMLWRIQGKSFNEIVSLRYSFLSRRDERRTLTNEVRKGNLSGTVAQAKIAEMAPIYSPVAAPIPNVRMRTHALYPSETNVFEIDYDTLVYDTYDYLDKVISLSLSNPICAALQIYSDSSGDERAISLRNYIKYGTNDPIEIWLLKYGFDSEDVEWIKPYVVHIDSAQINFRDSITELPPDKLEIVARYIYE